MAVSRPSASLVATYPDDFADADRSVGTQSVRSYGGGVHTVRHAKPLTIGPIAALVPQFAPCPLAVGCRGLSDGLSHAGLPSRGI